MNVFNLKKSEKLVTIPLEKEIERKFVEWIRSHGWKTVKFSDSAQKGAPDRVVFMRLEQCYFVEFKRPKGVLAEHQKQYAKELSDFGFEVYLIDSFEKKHLFCNDPFNPKNDNELLLLNAI